MKTLEQVIDKEVVKEAGLQLFRGVAIGTAMFAVIFGIAAWLLMQLPTC